MTEKEYKQLFLDPRFRNLSNFSTKDRLVYLVQQYQDADLESITNVPFKISGILFEPDETIFGLKEFDVDKNMSYAAHLYTMKEFVFALYSADREAILMLLDDVILSNTCGKKFIKGLINNLKTNLYARYKNEYLKPKWERIINEKLYENVSLEEIKFDAYNDIKALGILADGFAGQIDDVFLKIHSINRRYFSTDNLIRNALESIKGAKNGQTIALIIGEMTNSGPFSGSTSFSAIPTKNELNEFLIKFLKENLNKKRKRLSLTDIKCKEAKKNG